MSAQRRSPRTARHAFPGRRLRARPTPRHGRGRRRRPVVRAVAGTTVVVLLSAVAATGAMMLTVQRNLDSADVEAYLEDRQRAPEPEAPSDGYAGRPLDVLLMGTDMRDEENAALAGDDDAMNADTTILAHLSADRSRVDLVSVPRDSLVHIPACTRPDGTTSRPRDGAMFNSAFAVGAGGTGDLAAAAACTQLTFEANTGLRVDETVVLKMDGVRDVVDALGGIPVDLPEAMHSPMAGLAVPAGPQVLDGTTALAFLRARTGTGFGLEMGSDLARIERQQFFLHAFAARVQELGLLKDPARLISVLTTTARSLSVSERLADIRTMAGLGFALRDLDPGTLSPVSVPVTAAPSDPNRVVWTPEAAALWERLRHDLPLVDADPPAADDDAAAHALDAP